MNPNPFVQGTCFSMCPLAEIYMREEENLVHVLEGCDDAPFGSGRKYKIIADPKKMVKSFQRSGVGREMQCPENIRPPYVLKRTVDYLLRIIVNVNHVQWSIVYGFVTDRLRAVLQDLIIQQPPTVKCLDILEPIVRFYAYSAYRLCEESIYMFDPKLNESHFNESFARLLSMYNSEDIETKSRWEMESLYLLHNIGDNYVLNRALSLSANSDTTFEMALVTSLAWVHNDYFTICQLFTKFPVLHQIVLASKLTTIRRNALKAMNIAYSCKNLSYPLCNVTKLLLFNNDKEACTECQYYGLKVEDGRVCFLKGTFDQSVKEATVKKIASTDAALKITNISQMLLQNNYDENFKQ